MYVSTCAYMYTYTYNHVYIYNIHICLYTHTCMNICSNLSYNQLYYLVPRLWECLKCGLLFCAMCQTESVLCARFGLCHVSVSATNLFASLRNSLAFFGRDPDFGPTDGPSVVSPLPCYLMHDRRERSNARSSRMPPIQM